MNPTLLVLAAGRGSRFGGSKQRAPVGPSGEPLSAYTIHDALRGGFGSVVLVCPEGRGEAMVEEFRRWTPAGLPLRFTEQTVPADRDKPWGTGHAVLCARELLGNRPFAVANADDFYGRRALEALAGALAAPGRRAQVLIGYRLGNTLVHTEHVSRGLCTLEGHRLEEIREVLDLHWTDDGGPAVRGRGVDGTPVQATGEEPVSMNLWGFVPPFLELLAERWRHFRDGDPGPEAEFLLPGAVADLVGAGRTSVDVTPTESVPFGLTRPDDLDTVRAEIARRIASGDYPADLRSGPEARRSL